MRETSGMDDGGGGIAATTTTGYLMNQFNNRNISNNNNNHHQNGHIDGIEETDNIGSASEFIKGLSFMNDLIKKFNKFDLIFFF